jgi:hypothetical protein
LIDLKLSPLQKTKSVNSFVKKAKYSPENTFGRTPLFSILGLKQKSTKRKTRLSEFMALASRAKKEKHERSMEWL